MGYTLAGLLSFTDFYLPKAITRVSINRALVSHTAKPAPLRPGDAGHLSQIFTLLLSGCGMIPVF